ncbi:hypothetical protein I4F81_003592 [Pyropia yezoensis]|uniref:Uncharacterized protein n=1 Tax=Pyropia yezoensis TaxID=2788 RepID=A0ACC3BU71_PYRYE|nr:hypothetical protein I4F81_003592 [Neopyropia yezoensis]
MGGSPLLAVHCPADQASEDSGLRWASSPPRIGWAYLTERTPPCGRLSRGSQHGRRRPPRGGCRRRLAVAAGGGRSRYQPRGHSRCGPRQWGGGGGGGTLRSTRHGCRVTLFSAAAANADATAVAAATAAAAAVPVVTHRHISRRARRPLRQGAMVPPRPWGASAARPRHAVGRGARNPLHECRGGVLGMGVGRREKAGTVRQRKARQADALPALGMMVMSTAAAPLPPRLTPAPPPPRPSWQSPAYSCRCALKRGAAAAAAVGTTKPRWGWAAVHRYGTPTAATVAAAHTLPLPPPLLMHGGGIDCMSCASHGGWSAGRAGTWEGGGGSAVAVQRERAAK